MNASKVFRNGDLGLVLYMPFDDSSGETEHHERFRKCPASREFQFKVCNDIPTYARCFGTDVDLAVRIHWEVASAVYYNADSMVFECRVHEEDPRKSSLPRS